MYAVVGIIVLIIVLVLVMSNKKSAVIEDVINDPQVEDITAVNDPEKAGVSVGSNAGKYAEMVLKYKDRTLQFNAECAVVRNSYTFKQGTDVMLDNRDTAPAKIVVGSRTFNLQAQSYRVIDLGSTGTYRVDCNDRLNVVTVNVQQ